MKLDYETKLGIKEDDHNISPCAKKSVISNLHHKLHSFQDWKKCHTVKMFVYFDVQ